MAGGEHVRSGPVKLTYDDLLMLPDDGKRHEIVDGEHYVTPSPFTKHQTVSMNLTKIFVRYLDRHPIGYLLAAPMDVVFSDFDVVEPDLLFVSRERRAVITDKHVMGAPDLVIEIGDAGVVVRQVLSHHVRCARMGRKHLVDYGLYRTHIYFSPAFAAKTGFKTMSLF